MSKNLKLKIHLECQYPETSLDCFVSIQNQSGREEVRKENQSEGVTDGYLINGDSGACAFSPITFFGAVFWATCKELPECFYSV